MSRPHAESQGDTWPDETKKGRNIPHYSSASRLVKPIEANAFDNFVPFSLLDYGLEVIW
jgi:hypothetical protein